MFNFFEQGIGIHLRGNNDFCINKILNTLFLSNSYLSRYINHINILSEKNPKLMKLFVLKKNTLELFVRVAINPLKDFVINV